MNVPERMRLLFLLGSRGEWGYIRPIIDEASTRGHKASICATNMSLLANYGSLINEIVDGGYDVSHQILNSLEGGSRTAMAKSIGLLQLGFVDLLAQKSPDWVILAGDRAEQMAAATACAYTYTPSAHIQAGERSGNIDGLARHAIARLVHLHFAANLDASERLIRTGEDPWRVHVTGAPQLDEIRSKLLPDSSDLSYTAVKPQSPFVLACFHPVTEQIGEAVEQVSAVLDVLSTLSTPVVWILPNNDAGGAQVRERVLSGIRGIDSAYANLPREKFLALLRDCQLLIGNSSSGLIEAPSFGTPVVNVGSRQSERLQGSNVINAPLGSRNQITDALRMALNLDFRSKLAYLSNPYGDGDSAPRILDILERVPRDDRLVQKQITY